MHTRALFALVGLGALLRLRGLSVHSLWLDEAIAVHTATALDPVTELVRVHQPPLSFLLLGAWIELAGTSDVALRLLPALLSILALVLFARLAQRWLDPAPALFAVALFAVAPTQVWFGQEVQMYALLSCATLMVLLGADSCLRARTGMDHERRGHALVASGSFLAFGSHYLGALMLPMVIALAIAATASGRVRLGPAVLLVCAAGLGTMIWLPWVFVVFQAQLGSLPISSVTSFDPVFLASLPIRQVLIWTSMLPETLRELAGLVGGILVGGLGLQALRFVAARRVVVCFPVLAFLVPVSLIVVFSLFLPAHLQPRSLVIAAPGAILSMAGGLAVLRPAWLRNLVFVLLGGTLLVITWVMGERNLREDWRAAAADVVLAYQPGDLVFSVTGTEEVFAQAPLRHYLRDHPQVLKGLLDARARIDHPEPEPLPSGVRVHLVFRDAPYAESDRQWFESRMYVLNRGPVRHRIQHIQFETR